MISTGIIRRVDELGRIVIDKSIRDQLGLIEGTRILIYLDKRKNIVIRKAKEGEIGVIRIMDSLGRIVIPKEIVDILNIKVKDKIKKTLGDEIEQFVLSDRIILQKYVPFCIFCGSNNKMENYEGKKVCNKCMKKITQITLLHEEKEYNEKRKSNEIKSA